MNTTATDRYGDKTQSSTQPANHERGSQYEVLAGVGFFVIAGVAATLAEWPHDFFPIPRWSGVAAFFGAYLIIAIGFGIGWIKGFPRWSYPYAFYTMAYAYYMMRVATPGLRLFGHTFEHDELWGWRAWIPCLVVAVIAVLATRSPRPFLRLAQRLRADWTQISFGLYGVLPLVVLFLFDEVSNRFQFPFVLLWTGILIVGALMYMRSASEGRRALSLVGGTILTALTAAAGTGLYWNGRYEAWMKEPANGYAVALSAIVAGIAWLCLMLLPALLRFFAPKRPELAG